jgi:hypothetical protein
MAVNPSIQLGTSGNWAIKEDNLLAYKQLGNKFFDREFDFSRGTRATFVGRNGFIQESGLTSAELVTNGDFATDSDWVKSGGATISGGQANIVGDGTSFTSIRSQYSIFTIGKKYKVSVDVTISSGLGLKFQDGANNENIGFATTSGTYVFYFTGTSSADFVIGRRTSGTAFNSSVNNVSIKEIQVDVPRIDFTDDPTGHLLLEPQSTNLVLNSNDLTNNTWSKYNATASSSTIINPKGTSGASLYTCDNYTGNNQYFRINPNTTYSNDVGYNYSMFVKYNTFQFCKLTYVNFTAQEHFTAVFDVINGTVTANNSGGSPQNTSANIQDFGNGWFRISISAAITSSAFNAMNFEFNKVPSGTPTFTANNGRTDQTTTTNDKIYVYGAQLEQKSYPTSYIPTSGSAVTRNQELCNNSGTVNDFNSEEGVLYAEIAALANDLTFREIALSDGTRSNTVELKFTNNSNEMQVVVRANGGVQSARSTSAYTITNFNKIAFKYKLNNFSFWVNGVNIATDPNGNTPIGLSELSFNDGFGDNFFGKTKNVKAFKRALTDAELYLLTVTQYQSYQEMATALNYTL